MAKGNWDCIKDVKEREREREKYSFFFVNVKLFLRVSLIINFLHLFLFVAGRY